MMIEFGTMEVNEIDIALPSMGTVVGHMTIERGWTEALHPRAAGKFAPKGSQGTHAPAQPAMAASKGGKGGKKKAGGKGGSNNEALSFNGKTGAGYGKPGGDQRVHGLQSELNRLGFADSSGKALKLDGKLGPKTTAAIKRAQRALGLKPDGIATPALLSKLKTATHTRAPKKAVKRMPHKATPKKKAAFGKQGGSAAQMPSASAKKAAYRKNVSAA